MRARSDTPRGRWAREEEDARRLAVKLPGPRESRRTIDAGREAPSGRSSDIAPRREEGVGDRSTRAKVCAARQLVPGFQNAAVQPGPATFKTGARYAPDVCASPLGTDDAIPRQLDTPSRTAPRRDGRERAARRLPRPARDVCHGVRSRPVLETIRRGNQVAGSSTTQTRPAAGKARGGGARPRPRRRGPLARDRAATRARGGSQGSSSRNARTLERRRRRGSPHHHRPRHEDPR